MCQDALSELKMRIRVSGDHKQKIQLQVTVDGLKIKDEKSGVRDHSNNTRHSGVDGGLTMCHVNLKLD